MNPLEALFELENGLYLYIQHLDDDPEYDFDYTLFNKNFKDIDGGVFGTDGGMTLYEAAYNVLKEYGGLGDTLTQADIDLYYQNVR